MPSFQPRTPSLGSTRENATEANFDCKVQAVTVYWRLRAQGVAAMEAYERAGRFQAAL